MGFPEKLAQLREQHKLSQYQFAKRIGLHVSQIKRYEASTSQPTLDVLKKIALAFDCTTDELIFGPEKGSDPLRLKFEIVRNEMDDDERKVVEEVLGALILRHQAKTLSKAG